jgi:hypothetical protein
MQWVGFTPPQLVHEGASIIAGLDRLLGRTWNPRRLARWEALLDHSLLRPSGAPKRCGGGGDLCEAGEEALASRAIARRRSDDVEDDGRTLRRFGTRRRIGIDHVSDSLAVDSHRLHLGLETRFP